MHTGACLCGAVRFEVSEMPRDPEACHCSQCRKQSGHFWAAVAAPRASLTINGAEHLTWYFSSETVRRGFCATCGSFLFWDPVLEASIDIAMGAFDAPTGMRLATHIFVADKGDYYDITDGLPQKQQ